VWLACFLQHSQQWIPSNMVVCTMYIASACVLLPACYDCFVCFGAVWKNNNTFDTMIQLQSLE
jgi:hypothetical protein